MVTHFELQGESITWANKRLAQAMSFLQSKMPNVRELDHDPLEVVRTIMALSENAEYQAIDCVRVVCAADFLGADKVLAVLNTRLSCKKYI